MSGYSRGEKPDPADTAVRSAYRALPTEQPPAFLDRKIRAEARAAVVAWRPRWLAPVALAATALLSFALVMRLALPPERSAPEATVAVPSGDSPRSQPAERAAPAFATLDAPTLASDADILARKESSNGGLDQSPEQLKARSASPTTRIRADAGYADAARQTSATANQPAEVVSERETRRSNPAAIPSGSDSARDSSAALRREVGCTPNQREDNQRWIACMQALKAAHDGALASEIRAWQIRYPDVPLPDDLIDPD